jgi:DNA-binding transcriptional LysR family regulator
MTLQQLRYVTTVAEAGTISGAAKELFISQPSLTTAIQELEKELGITIFLRTNRGVVLSREGEEFLGYARQILMQTQLLEERYGRESTHKQEFSVSSLHYNFAARAFAQIVQKLGGERYTMTFRETNTYEVIEDVRLLRSEVGVLLMTEQNREVMCRLFKEGDLRYTELTEKDAVIYVSHDHPLAGRSAVTEADLAPYPCLTFEQGRHNALFFSEDVSKPAITPRHIVVRDRATANDFTRELQAYQVSAGLDDADSFRLYRSVKLNLQPRRKVSLGYIVREQMLLSPMAQAFITAMEQMITKQDEKTDIE